MISFWIQEMQNASHFHKNHVFQFYLLENTTEFCSNPINMQAYTYTCRHIWQKSIHDQIRPSFALKHSLSPLHILTIIVLSLMTSKMAFKICKNFAVLPTLMMTLSVFLLQRTFLDAGCANAIRVHIHIYIPI